MYARQHSDRMRKAQQAWDAGERKLQISRDQKGGVPGWTGAETKELFSTKALEKYMNNPAAARRAAGIVPPQVVGETLQGAVRWGLMSKEEQKAARAAVSKAIRGKKLTAGEQSLLGELRLQSWNMMGTPQNKGWMQHFQTMAASRLNRRSPGELMMFPDEMMETF